MNLLERATAIGVQGFLHCEELEQLVTLAANREVLEVGSFMGLSAWGMALTAKKILCVDTFRANTAGQQQMSDITTLPAFKAATARYTNVEAFVGTSECAAKANEHLSFDMIFIDAMHTYEDVKADIIRWIPRLRPGGIMAFHDYGHGDFPGVAKAVDEMMGWPENKVVTLAWIQKAS